VDERIRRLRGFAGAALLEAWIDRETTSGDVVRAATPLVRAPA
jgi:hypothetical protein